MLEHSDILDLVDRAYLYGYENRVKGAEDLVFYWLTHWGEDELYNVETSFRGEFDIVRKAGRSILTDMDSNQIQVDFEPVDEDRDDAADLADGLYRKGLSGNQTINAFRTASQESVVCGGGGWKLYTEYKTNRRGDSLQVIRRMPINEANNTVLWDPDSVLLDRSDADYCSVIWGYTPDGYKKLVSNLTGEDEDEVDLSGFDNKTSYTGFNWSVSGGEKIYVCELFHREEVKDKVLTMTDPMGEEILLLESELVDVMDEMLDTGFEIESEKEITRGEVTRYIVSGKDIIESDIVAGEHIPVVPQYGEAAYVEGEFHSEGVTRLAKDPQRLRDFQLSYLADIVSKSPRQKPILTADQIAGYEGMYEIGGSENNYPYLLQNRFDSQGQALPIGPIALMPETPIPPALIASIQLSRESIEDVATQGAPNGVADVDLSGTAVNAINAQIEKQSLVYQENRKQSLRRDGEIWLSMAQQVYDIPRSEMIELPDGSTKRVSVMEQIVDNETGEIVTLNDLTNTEFEVTSKIGASYSSKKEQTLARIDSMLQYIPPGDPMRDLMLLKGLTLTDGVDFDDVRDYARQQLVLKGFVEPETDEEKEALAAAQQKGSQPSAEMMLGMAEMKKAQVAEGELNLKNGKLQLEAQIAQMKGRVDAFKAQTDRMNTQVDAQEAGAKIENTRIDSFGKQIDNQAKIIELQNPEKMSTEDLFQSIATG